MKPKQKRTSAHGQKGAETMEVNIQALAGKLSANIRKVIIGKDAVIEKTIISLLCGGHILLEDIPGSGKTTLAKALARSIGCKWGRVQFTPDLLPSELTGINYYNQKEAAFLFKPGAIFTNILLGDEINRATPRTQSSLLECMEERQVSVDGVTYPLDKPFLVIATQNPIEIQGTFPLPEAQLDRFFMRLSMGYPDPDSEKQMLLNLALKHPVEDLEAVTDGGEIVEAQSAVRGIKLSDAVRGYIVSIVNATRQSDKVRLGVSPRGSLALMRAAQAAAAVAGRDYVLPDDVKKVACDVLAHRIVMKGFSAAQSSDASAKLLEVVLAQTPAPVEG